ncbi:hypothetical protein ABZ297_08780 [Nonomuraea sp. NPDC005983]
MPLPSALFDVAEDVKCAFGQDPGAARQASTNLTAGGSVSQRDCQTRT